MKTKDVNLKILLAILSVFLLFPQSINAIIQNTKYKKHINTKEEKKETLKKTISILTATDAINLCLFKIVIQQINKDIFNGKPIYKEIVVSQEHPLKILLSNNPNAFIEQENRDNAFPHLPGAPGTVRSIHIDNKNSTKGNISVLC